MKAVPMLLTALLLGAGVAISGCADPATTGPAAGAVGTSLGTSGPQNSTSAPQDHNAALLSKCKPLAPHNVHRWIGPAGGTLTIGPHTLTVRPGALSQPVNIRAKIVGAKSVNVVELKPKGLVLQPPAVLTMSYANCDREGRTSPLSIAVVDDRFVIVDYLSSSDDPAAGTVTGDVPDFSNYAVAW